MSIPVSPGEIERIVGVKRHATEHYARAVMAEETVYILHSRKCREGTNDLRDCPFSLALDRGIDRPAQWSAWQWVPDRPVRVEVSRGWLMPTPDAVEEARSRWYPR